jgi:DNA-binding IclR family transcriptional regulator
METPSTTGNEVAEVKSALRVLDVLEVLAGTTDPVGASELARRLQVPKSSTHKLLATLERRGYVVGDEARRFRLHPMYARDGNGWVGGPIAALRRLAGEPLARLAHVTGESAFLGVLRDRTSFEYVDKVVSVHEVRCDAELGEARLLHASSVGLVLLAFRSAQELDHYLEPAALRALTPKTITDPARLRRELAAVRRKGFAVTHDTNAVGASGIAVPILGAGGEALAGLNVSAPSSRFDGIVERAHDELVRVAGAIAAALQLERRAEAV